MERKGFNRDHYRVFHPGGRLGKQLIKVGDLMHAGPEMPLVDSGTPMREALVTMAGRSFGCIGIVGLKGRDKGRLIGIVTDGDLRRHIERSEEHTSELQSLMRISYAVFCLKKKKKDK